MTRARLAQGTGVGGRVLALAGPAHAQQAAPAPEKAAADQPKDQQSLFGDIIVTANKRSEKLQNVGISASAFSGETITRLGFHSATEITRITPALSINYINPSSSTLSIRGVSQNDFADHLEPPVAVYAESYIGTSGANAVPMFDTARVEVLRGPQGTLFGRNATGGLLHFVSVEPSEKPSAYVQASYSRFNTLNLEGALGGKIAEGVLGRLLRAQHQRRAFHQHRHRAA
jgi:iron complex outermembrane receptor protein